MYRRRRESDAANLSSDTIKVWQKYVNRNTFRLVSDSTYSYDYQQKYTDFTIKNRRRNLKVSLSNL